MKSQVVKRSIVIAGHKTSVSLEDAFWKGLKEIAAMRNIPLSDLVSTIDNERQHGNLSIGDPFVCSRSLPHASGWGHGHPGTRLFVNADHVAGSARRVAVNHCGVNNGGAVRNGGAGLTCELPGGRVSVTGGGSAGAGRG